MQNLIHFIIPYSDLRTAYKSGRRKLLQTDNDKVNVFTPVYQLFQA